MNFNTIVVCVHMDCCTIERIHQSFTVREGMCPVCTMVLYHVLVLCVEILHFNFGKIDLRDLLNVIIYSRDRSSGWTIVFPSPSPSPRDRNDRWSQVQVFSPLQDRGFYNIPTLLPHLRQICQLATTTGTTCIKCHRFIQQTDQHQHGQTLLRLVRLRTCQHCNWSQTTTAKAILMI